METWEVAQVAESDQASAAVRDVGRLIVTFRRELVAASFPSDLADELTREYFLHMIDGPARDADDDDE